MDLPLEIPLSSNERFGPVVGSDLCHFLWWLQRDKADFRCSIDYGHCLLRFKLELVVIKSYKNIVDLTFCIKGQLMSSAVFVDTAVSVLQTQSFRWQD